MAERYTAKEMLAKLVSFQTVSHNSNLDLIQFVENYLEGFGIAAHRVPDATGEKASLFAHIGPSVDGGVILSGHTDVVPVEGQPWSTDPFTLTEQDGRLYGRGACDMKGFLALALAAVPDMIAAPLSRPIHLALSYDEEVGCLGAPPMIEAMNASGPRAATCIVGEPSMMQIADGHKGVCGLTVSVRGFEVHSSLLPTGVSAVMTAARLITWLHERNAENAAKVRDEDLAFAPPFTTLHSGIIAGGTAHNITALDCTFTVDIRAIPTEDLHGWKERFTAYCKEVETEIRTIRPEAAITIEERAIVEGLQPEKDGAADALVRRISGQNASIKVPYGTEGGQFQAGGYSTVICGPGSIDQAHQPDEFISVEQLEKGERFMSALIADLSR